MSCFFKTSKSLFFICEELSIVLMVRKCSFVELTPLLLDPLEGDYFLNK